MRKVQQIMGMPISIDIPDCDAAAVFDAAFGRLRQIDDKFSTYKPSSEVSRFAAGKIAEEDLSDELKQVIKACRKAEAQTDGYFSAWAKAPSISHLDAVQGSKEEQASRIEHTVSAATDAADAAMRQKPAGAAGSAGGQGQAMRNRWLDPSGYVKGWAIAEAGKVIENSGYKTYCAGAGGDILARSDTGFKWKIGIQDPGDKSKILDVLSISNGAVCTSGSYERGAHIINPKTKKPAKGLLSVTITGPDIIQADVLATACFAMGKSRAMEFTKSQTGYEIMAV
jgi:FAD:protein FMN transferase